MAKEKTEPVEYIVSLPSIHDVHFQVATPQYSLLRRARFSLTTATSPASAISKVVFRTLRDKDAARRIVAGIRDGTQYGYSGYAFEVPEVFAEDGKSLQTHEKTTGLDWALCDQIMQNRGDISEKQGMSLARELVDFYQGQKSQPRPQPLTQ